MKVLVTGGNGLLGSNVIQELIKRDYAVRAMLRKDRILPVENENIELFYGNLTEKEDLYKAVDGCDCIIHTAAMTSQNTLDYEKFKIVNVDSTENILKAVNKFNCKRLVFVSSANAFAYGSIEQPGNEQAPYIYPFTKSPYSRSKYEAQNIVLDFPLNKTSSVVIVNPTFMLGKYDTKPSSGAIILRGYKKRLILIPPGGKNFIHVKDVAEAICNAITRGRNKECYILANENLSYKAFYRNLCEVTGQKSRIITVPAFILSMLGIVGSVLLNFGIKNRFHYNNMAIVSEDTFYGNAKAKSELDLGSTAIAAAIKVATNWFKSNDMVDQ